MSSPTALAENRRPVREGAAQVRARASTIAVVITNRSDKLLETLLPMLIERGFTAIERKPSDAPGILERLRPGLVVALVDPRQPENATMIQLAAGTDAYVLVIAPSIGCWSEALQAGADAFLSEAEAVRMLDAQLGAIQRRIGSGSESRADGEELFLGPYLIDREARRVFIGAVQVPVTRAEFLVLAHLVENAGRVVSHRELFEFAAGGPTKATSDPSATIKQYVYRLRRKFLVNTPGAHLIANVRGFGYFVDRNTVRTVT